MDLRELQDLLGHTSARMTERYAHFAASRPAPRGLTWSVPKDAGPVCLPRTPSPVRKRGKRSRKSRSAGSEPPNSLGNAQGPRPLS
jgi:hypothetical protein